MHNRVALLLIMVMSVLVASAQVDGRAQPGLFSAASAPAAPPQREPTAAVRSRYVAIDLGLIGSADSQRLADQLTLNLFDDVTYTAIRTDSTALGPGRFTWVGTLAGVAGGQITISVEDGVLAAGIAAGADFYTVRTVGDQRYRIDLLDQTAEQIDLGVDHSAPHAHQAYS